MKKAKNGIPIVQINGEYEKELADRFDIQGYPTLLLFRKGTPIEYTGARTFKNILAWIKEKTLNVVPQLTIGNLDNIYRKEKSMVIFLKNLDESLLNFYKEFAYEHHNFSFYYTLDQNLFSKFGIGGEGGLSIVQRYSKNKID